MSPRLGWGLQAPLTLGTHRLVPADGPPGAGLAASAGEGEAARFAPMFPVAAPLGEPQREAGLEWVLGAGDGGCWGCLWAHCVLAQVCTRVPLHVPQGMVSLTPHPVPRDEVKGVGGAKAAQRAQGCTLRCGDGTPQTASPTLLLVATNRLSRVALFSLEGK